MNNGLGFLGFRVFYYHKLLNKRNIRKMNNKLLIFKNKLDERKINYDEIYASFEGWIAYAKHADTYKLRKESIKKFEEMFPHEVSSLEVNRLLKIKF